MADEGKLRIDIRDSERAKRLLDDSMLKETFQGLQNEYIKAWTQADTTEKRETMFFQLQGLLKAEHHLRKLLHNGMIARRELAQLEAERKAQQARQEQQGRFNVS